MRAARASVDQDERCPRSLLLDIKLGVAHIDAPHGQFELFLPARRLRDFREKRCLDVNDPVEDGLPLLSLGLGRREWNGKEPEQTY